MRQQDGAHHRQAHAGAAVAAPCGKERLEDAPGVARRNAAPVVAHGQAGGTLIRRGAQHHPLCPMFRSVAQQMAQHDPQPCGMQRQRHIPSLHLRCKAWLIQRQCRHHIGQRRLTQIAHLARLCRHPQGRQLRRNLPTGTIDITDQPAILVGQRSAVDQQFHRRADRRQRGFQLMRHMVGIGADRGFAAPQRLGHGDDPGGRGMQLAGAEMLRRCRGCGIFQRPGIGLQPTDRAQQQPHQQAAQQRRGSSDRHRQQQCRVAIADLRPQIAQRHQPGKGQAKCAGQSSAKHHCQRGTPPPFHRQAPSRMP